MKTDKRTPNETKLEENMGDEKDSEIKEHNGKLFGNKNFKRNFDKISDDRFTTILTPRSLKSTVSKTSISRPGIGGRFHFNFLQKVKETLQNKSDSGI